MLRLYKPITNDIFKLHEMLKHLVCSVWCTAEEDVPCESLLDEEFKKLQHYKINKETSLEQKIKDIYLKFAGLSPVEKAKVKEAFNVTNEIEKLCNKELKPVYLNELPLVVDEDIKPLFEWCYNEFLDKGKVAGDKLAYYKELIRESDFQYCPCCGLIDFESPVPENEVREANDHYLPKSKYPFASVNFKNLVPLCYKCNSDRKSAKDPIENDRKAFYPFAVGEHNISIKVEIDRAKDIDKLERADLNIILTGDADKIKTWDWLFDISDRYNDKIRPRLKTFFRDLKIRHRQHKKSDPDLTISDVIDMEIEVCAADKYSDWKFLKIPLLNELKQRTDLISVL